ncbi:MAG: cytochrome c oxidase assembly protein [Oceanospirillaceae bacterium]|jgi:protein SCO1/2|uniref:SCO family protein n=1 Tax=Thalassolituus sp. TaxID=2030822 RepID=UPI000C387F0F|nr:SCO family protein [Thalassolituus sp.]MAE35930.1 cytochrome c oxidase assembly protein [Oceanospirillaceae bacterium]MDQ4423449.1 SCO family protein [Thalassolituus sp.]MDQ4426648.1 SCO family protein [Thalassolituus sp.]|tara:strand:+ start:124 stop:753 length:630 start_codon:yes stop_codon:yes gene_type:complete
MRGERSAIVLCLALFAVLLVAFVVGWWSAPPSPQERLTQTAGVEMFAGGQVGDLSFINEYGDAVSLADLKGRWSLLFFGYTYCPDICPMTLMHMNRLMKRLSEAEREQLNVVLVSVDPERDKPEQLGQYMDYFNPEFKALTGNPDNMKKLAAQLNAFYARVDREDGGYLMDHSANIVLLDSELNYRGYIEPPHDPERMLPVIRSVLALP